MCKVESCDGALSDEFGVEDFGDQNVGSSPHLLTGSFADPNFRRTFPDQTDLVGKSVQSDDLFSAVCYWLKFLINMDFVINIFFLRKISWANKNTIILNRQIVKAWIQLRIELEPYVNHPAL